MAGALIRVNLKLAFPLIGGLAWLLLPVPARGEPYALTNEWSVDLRSDSDSAPAVGTDGTIYVGTWKGQLWALNPDGSRKWVFQARNEIKSAPAVGLDGTVYFGCRDRKFYAVRADGKKRWEFQTGGWVDSSPALATDGTVYFGSWDKSFYALNADGTKRWQFTTPGEIVSSPAIGADGTIYFGSHDRKFYALAPDGRKKWEFATGGPIISSPALNKDQCLYFTSVDGCLYALNLDGSLRWRLRTGGITESSPVIGLDGTIYVGVLQHLWAIHPDGKKKWGGIGGVVYILLRPPRSFWRTGRLFVSGIRGCGVSVQSRSGGGTTLCSSIITARRRWGRPAPFMCLTPIRRQAASPRCPTACRWRARPGPDSAATREIPVTSRTNRPSTPNRSASPEAQFRWAQTLVRLRVSASLGRDAQ